MKSSEYFEGIAQTAVKVGPYNTFYPVFYRDTAYMSVFLLAPLDKVKSLLPSKRMHPFRLTPWHGILLEFGDHPNLSNNGVKLDAKFYPANKTDKVPTVILLHGFPGNQSSPLD